MTTTPGGTYNIQSTLMQNYWDEVPVVPTGTLTAVVDTNGSPACFSVGNSNKLFCVLPSGPGSAESTLENTGLVVVSSAPYQWAVGAGAMGSLVAFALTSSGLMVTTRDPVTATWSTPVAISSPVSSPLVGIKARNCQSNLVLSVFTNWAGSTLTPCPYQVCWTRWLGAAVDTWSQLPFAVDSFFVEPGFDPTRGNTGLVVLLTPQVYPVLQSVANLRSGQKLFEDVYKDRLSGARMDLALWRILLPPSFFLVGDLALGGFDSPPSNQQLMIVTSVEDPTPGATPILRQVAATDLAMLWDDTKSGAWDDGSIWYPSIGGYVALGYIGDGDNEGVAPTVAGYVAVRADFTCTASVVSQGATSETDNKNCIYTNQGSDSAAPVAVDGITPPPGGLQAYTFGAHTDFGLPAYAAYALLKNQPLATTFVFVTDDGQIDAVTAIPTTSNVVAMSMCGDSGVFAVLADGSLVYSSFVLGAWTPVPAVWNGNALALTAVAAAGGSAASDEQGAAAAYLLTASGQLFHVSQLTSGDTPWESPILVDNADLYRSITSVLDDSGHAYAYGTTSAGDLMLAYQDPVTTDWTVAEVEIPATNAIVSGYTYTVDVQVLDTLGVPLSGTAATPNTISIQTNDTSILTANGMTALVDHEALDVSPDLMGRVTITYNTIALSAPLLILGGPVFGTITVQPNLAIQAALAKSAQDIQTNLGVPEDLATPLQQIMQSAPAAPPTAAALAAAFSKEPKGRAGDATPNRDLVRTLDAIDLARVAESHWRVTFTRSSAKYVSMTRDEAATWRDLTARSTADASPLTWLADLGDLVLEGVEGLLGDELTLAFSAATTGITASVQFLFQGVSYLFTSTVQYVSQAFDLVALVFSRVQGAFEKAVQWLGFMFDWDDILRTKEGIKHILTLGPGLVVAAMPTLNAGIANASSWLTSQIQQTFAGWIGNIGSLSSNTPPAPQDGVSSSQANGQGTNIIGDYFTRNLSTLSAPAGGTVPPSATAAYNSILGLAASITSSATTLDGVVAPAAAGGADTLLQSALIAILNAVENVLLAAVAGMTTALQTLVAALADLMSAFDALLAQTWEIPFISDLYRHISGGAGLSVADVLALLVAIPTTIIHKLAFDAAPFPAQADLDAFTTQASVQAFAALFGFGASPALTASPSTWRAVINRIGTALCLPVHFAYGGFALGLDTLPLNVKPPKAAVIGAVVVEWLMFLVNNPYVVDPNNTELPGFTSANALGNLFGALSGAGALVETAVCLASGSTLKNLDNRALIADVVLGGLEIAYVVIEAVAIANEGGEQNTDLIAAGLLVNVPCVLRISRLSKDPRVLVGLGAVELATALFAGGFMMDAYLNPLSARPTAMSAVSGALSPG